MQNTNEYFKKLLNHYLVGRKTLFRKPTIPEYIDKIGLPGVSVGFGVSGAK